MIRIMRLFVRLVGGPEKRALLMMLSGVALFLLARLRQWRPTARKLLLTLAAAVVTAGILILVMGY